MGGGIAIYRPTINNVSNIKDFAILSNCEKNKILHGYPFNVSVAMQAMQAML